jgi:Family of unknown function (DUF5681)
MTKNPPPSADDSAKTTRKQREKRAGGVTGKGFQPGVSGNPNGRPRTAKFSEAARRLAEEIGQDGKTGAEQLAEHCFRCALKGSARHAEFFVAYTEGKPKQGVELSGPDGGALRFENMSDEQLDYRLKELLEKWKTDHP